MFILEQWEKNNMTIFFVTHDLEEAVYLGSRSIVLSQYYTTDLACNEGAKIVSDLEIPGPHPKPMEFKYSERMGQLIKKLRADGLDPQHRQHLRDFDLNHKDSFRTVSVQEWKR